MKIFNMDARIMSHNTETFHEGMDMHTVVECINCHKRISAQYVTSDAQWQRSVNAFLKKDCKHDATRKNERTS